MRTLSESRASSMLKQATSGFASSTELRAQTQDGRAGAEFDGVADDEAAPREEQDASARGIDGVTRSEDRAEVVGQAVAFRAVASNVEYPLGGRAGTTSLKQVGRREFHSDLRASTRARVFVAVCVSWQESSTLER